MITVNEYAAGQKDSRPWGDWEVLCAGEGYAVKRIRVSPGGRLSLQTHKHRAEHWFVVSGTARVTVGALVLDLTVLRTYGFLLSTSCFNKASFT